jgi:predicted small lipoprotein YifL
MAPEIRGSEIVEMTHRPIIAIVLAAGALLGCGQKGPLYLPEKTGEVVTRPAPAADAAPDAPRTIDTPLSGDTPAPEVTAPEDEAARKKDADRKDPAPPR